MAALKREKLACVRERGRERGGERVKASTLIGLFAKNTQTNTRSRLERERRREEVKEREEREREGEGNTPTERSVLILARKLRKTKEACRNSVSLDKSANRSSPRQEKVPDPQDRVPPSRVSIPFHRVSIFCSSARLISKRPRARRSNSTVENSSDSAGVWKFKSLSCD